MAAAAASAAAAAMVDDVIAHWVTVLEEEILQDVENDCMGPNPSAAIQKQCDMLQERAEYDGNDVWEIFSTASWDEADSTDDSPSLDTEDSSFDSIEEAETKTVDQGTLVEEPEKGVGQLRCQARAAFCRAMRGGFLLTTLNAHASTEETPASLRRTQETDDELKERACTALTKALLSEEVEDDLKERARIALTNALLPEEIEDDLKERTRIALTKALFEEDIEDDLKERARIALTHSLITVEAPDDKLLELARVAITNALLGEDLEEELEESARVASTNMTMSEEPSAELKERACVASTNAFFPQQVSTTSCSPTGSASPVRPSSRTRRRIIGGVHRSANVATEFDLEESPAKGLRPLQKPSATKWTIPAASFPVHFSSTGGAWRSPADAHTGGMGRSASTPAMALDLGASPSRGSFLCPSLQASSWQCAANTSATTMSMARASSVGVLRVTKSKQEPSSRTFIPTKQNPSGFLPALSDQYKSETIAWSMSMANVSTTRGTVF